MADEDVSISPVAMPAVAAVDIGALDRDAGHALDLRNVAGEGMTIERVTLQGVHAQDQLPTFVTAVGDCDRGLDPALVAGANLALGDAF